MLLVLFQDIFQLIVSTFSGLSDTTGPSFGRRVLILETMARYRSCVVMLDLECDDLINEMFSTFLAVARCVSSVKFVFISYEKWLVQHDNLCSLWSYFYALLLILNT